MNFANSNLLFTSSKKKKKMKEYSSQIINTYLLTLYAVYLIGKTRYKIRYKFLDIFNSK